MVFERDLGDQDLDRRRTKRYVGEGKTFTVVETTLVSKNSQAL